MDNLIVCWARLVSIVTEEGALVRPIILSVVRVLMNMQSLESFLTRGQSAVFENRRNFKLAESYWPFFLASLLQYGKTLEDFQVWSSI